MVRRAFLVVLFLLAAGSTLIPPRAASASVQLAVLFDDLVRDSSAICVATALEQKAAWEDGRIYTRTHVRCDQALAGDLKTGQEAWIRTMGGVVDGIGQSVAGEAVFAPNHTAVVFLHAAPQVVGQNPGAYEVTARAQGHFPVTRDADKPKTAMRSPDMGAVLPVNSIAIARVQQLARGPLTPSATQPAVQFLPGRTVDEIAKEVALAWQRTHAR